ncbi:hypothetical protein CC1G_11800 [Coprinopsis cinerea okayama7|uniref:Tyr recombinase domain-containing protein n=1 Tax=Coprinopsis cinerea (strain Okayama-7 / 130 / ATCC MYA-4618 / FGSC 9003) TaxID=240176 RepID=A8N807_COPC7|nr:hypothetical protein CC1G_11800 [Coprinopsis cinerea okayama7\|eukprot:XP_001830963.1 hypothetical protein CC1G_11800 [Coprinopsis cinerea okayama7\
MPYPTLLTPTPSTLRPHCLARERLVKWKPMLATEASEEGISEKDLERVGQVLGLSWEESTKTTYGSGLLAFHVFCDKRKVPEEKRAPVSNNVLAAFIATMAGAYSGKTLRNYVHGIRAWHLLHRVEWLMREDEVERLLKAADKLTPTLSKKQPREPVTPAYMVAVRNHMDLNDSLDAAAYACLTTCFYATARLGEFTVERITDKIDPSRHVTPKHLSETTDRNGNTVITLRIPRTKVSDDGEDVYWAKQNGETDPMAALENHRRVNQPADDEHLFTYRDTRGKRRPLSSKGFQQRIAAAARAAGLEPIPGHGLRIGSTLEYLLRGMPFETMKAKGRWAGDSFQRYLRKHAQVVAPYIQAVPEVHEDFVGIIADSGNVPQAGMSSCQSVFPNVWEPRLTRRVKTN